jgi:steroid delta-isomerase-like uncharacterized protein
MPDPDQLKQRLQEFYDEVINKGNLDAVDEFCTEDFVDHEEFPGITPDREGVKQFFGMMRAAFPDLHAEVHDMIAEGDVVVARSTMTGTHQGEFMGVPASNTAIEVKGIDIVRVPDGRQASEHWGQMDSLTLLQQIGAVPAPEEQPA